MDYKSLNFKDHDMLNRKKFVENIMNIIKSYEKIEGESDSLVLAIDSPWGTGKSFLINMWKNLLLSSEYSNEKYAVVVYNAWENDDSDNAFIPLVYNLQNLSVYSEDETFLLQVEEKSKEFLKKCGIAFLKDSIKKYIGEETANIINAGIEGASEKNVAPFFKKYESFLGQKNNFKDALLNLTPENGKLIVFIDELDRCKPDFAIKTLEIIKHYFDIKNIVFIFCVDAEQLAYSISTMYGANMDSCGYLRRFFDINIKIPSPDRYIYIKNILEHLPLENFLDADFYKTIAEMSFKLNLTLRDVNKILNNFFVFCLYYKDYMLNPKINIALEIYLYFIILKYKKPEIYDLILNQDYIAYDNSPKNWTVLDIKYFVTSNISEVLKELQIGRARDCRLDIIQKYGLFEYGTEELSFSKHIQNTVEMFL